MSWKKIRLGDILYYEQPTKYIVISDQYSDAFTVPVLTAGKSFVLGYTNEINGIYTKLPAIIFDDFTTESKYVDFVFKVKSSAMKILTTDGTRADLRFMFYLLSTINVDSELHKRYWISKFAEMDVKVPPLSTQKYIVQILDKADALRKKDKQLLQYYDELSQSLFTHMFGDPIRNEKNWEMRLVKSLAKKEKHSIKAGPFGSSLKKEYYVPNGYKIYGQEQVIKDDLTFGDYYIDENRYQQLKSCKVNAGDILISLVGTYGKISIVPDDFEPGIINPRLMKISLDSEICNSVFFKFLLQTKGVKKKISSFSRGGTMDIVNVGIISDISVINPPVLLQDEFAKQIQNIEKQKAKLKLQIKESENLFQILLQNAFNGNMN